ncbi:HD domain-containing protein [Orenia metallireducens]|uniref:HD domain-containing protein n=1 Tax=Orenia metallireducens TaxID=1413210 RepID=A0A285I686_9FIRM|nr:HD domain-containing phosphohydrolase [Orenia metallireducens]PRX23141.1 HD domain-containing protein [Orenia metallireducens]SNY42586.1 HD domain-containing protein [Orenia metallireducens]
MSRIKAEKRIISLYVIMSFLWILLSDKLVNWLFSDAELINYIQHIKGSLFIIISALIFYKIIIEEMDKLREAKEIIKEKYEEVEAYNEELMALNEELESVYGNEHRLNNRLERIIDLVSNITEQKIETKDDFLSYLFKTISELIPEIDSALLLESKDNQLCLVDKLGTKFEELEEITIDQQGLNFNNKIIKSTQTKKILTEKINQAEVRDLILDSNDQLILNISFKDNTIALIILTVNQKKFNLQDEQILISLINLSKTFFNVKEYIQLEIDFEKEIILSFIKILELYDNYTGRHSLEVAELSKKLAQKLKLSDEVIEQTYWAGLVHDIGKVGIPRKVLNKAGRLSDEEYEQIKLHPSFSSIMLSKSEKLKEISKYVLYHHERWDGKGYPEGIKGEQIPLVSQIICIADAWNAMTTDRIYRDKLPREVARQEIKDNRGKQFAPQIVDEFLEII